MRTTSQERSSSFRGRATTTKDNTFSASSLGWHPARATRRAADRVIHDIDAKGNLNMNAADSHKKVQSNHPYQRDGPLITGC